MKQVKCVITDDEPTACEGLQRYVEKVEFLSLMGVCEDTMQLNTLLHEDFTCVRIGRRIVLLPTVVVTEEEV